MKKIISFDKEILFPTMIGEITAISLDHTLKFLSKNDIEGDFIISGKYKMTEASTIEEDFKFTIPVDITTTESLTLDTTKIEISDFYYEIIDEEVLKAKIDILIEGVEEVLIEEEIIDAVTEELNRTSTEELEEKKEIEETVLEEIKKVIKEEEPRDCDGFDKTAEEKLDIEPVNDEKKNITKEKNHLNSIFRVFNDADETYKTYTVYIMRRNDTINTVLDKYSITKEQLEEYNDLSKIELDSKVIIPAVNE